ncbi:hypothetical protein BDW68DRAFT_179308 [Aspergillus falconensis]
MEDPMMDAFLEWGTGELTEFPDFFDFNLFDSTFSVPVQSPPAALSPVLPCEDPVPSFDDVPELISDYQPAAQDAVDSLSKLVGDLLSRVTALESLLQSESRKREALESYIEELQPFLGYLDSTIQRSET